MLTTSVLVAFLTRVVDTGVLEGDSTSLRRQKRILAAMHLIGLLGASVPMLLFGLAGFTWVVCCSVATHVIPYACNFAYYLATHNFQKARISFMCITFVGTAVPIFVAGGPQNSGYFPYYIGCPLAWLFLSTSVRETMVVQGFMCLIPVAATAARDALFDAFVARWHVVPVMAPTWGSWIWCANIIQVQCMYLTACVLLVWDLNLQLEAHEHLESRLAEVSDKLVGLNLEDIEAPLPGATRLEVRLYEVVQQMKRWKPYIPPLLFLKEAFDLDNNSSLGSELDAQNRPGEFRDGVESMDGRSSTSPFVVSDVTTPPAEPRRQSLLQNDLNKAVAAASSSGHRRSVSYAVTRTSTFTLSEKRTTIVLLQRRVQSPQGSESGRNLAEAEAAISEFLKVVDKETSATKGAIHQFFGNLLVCIWSGANHQLRACRSVLRVAAHFSDGSDDDRRRRHRGVRDQLLVSVSSGALHLGMIGYEGLRMPLLHGQPQVFAYQLLSLCDTIAGKILIDANVALQVQHELVVFPVDITHCAHTAEFQSTVYELCGEKLKGDTGEEWMYELQAACSRDSQDATEALFIQGFHQFSQGHFQDAEETFGLAIKGVDAGSCVSSSSSSSSSSAVLPVLRYHLQRLRREAAALLSPKRLCTSSTASLRPTRCWRHPWDRAYSLWDGSSVLVAARKGSSTDAEEGGGSGVMGEVDSAVYCSSMASLLVSDSQVGTYTI